MTKVLWPGTRKYDPNGKTMSLRGLLEVKPTGMKFPAAFIKAAERIAAEESEKRGQEIGKQYVIGTAAASVEYYPNLKAYYIEEVKKELEAKV